MSEVVYMSDNFALPQGYEKLDGIEVVRQKDDSFRINGLVELGEGDTKTIRKVQLPEPLEMWGYDTAESQAEWVAYKQDPEKWEMRQAIARLTQTVDYLTTKVEQLEGRVDTPAQPSAVQPEAAPPPTPEPAPRPEAILEPEAEEEEVVEYREPFTTRLRRRITGQPAPQYYEDEFGYFYYDDDGEPVYVEDNNSGGRVLAALGIAALAGFIGYELGKTNGHNYSSEFNEIINQNAGLKHQVHDLSHQLSAFEAKDTAQHIHDHEHELRAIHGIHNQIMREEARELRQGGLHEKLQDSGMYWGFRYPWDWASSKVGSLRAESWLHTLSAKAAQHGHKVRWIFNGYEPNGSVREILQVDGTTNTHKVLEIIGQYR